MTTLAADTEDAAVAARKMSWAATWWPRLRPLLLAVAFPVAMLAKHKASLLIENKSIGSWFACPWDRTCIT